MADSSILHTVHLATPKWWLTVLYSHVVAIHHSVIATRCSTLMDLRTFCVLPFIMWSQLCTDKEEGIFDDSKINKPV